MPRLNTFRANRARLNAPTTGAGPPTPLRAAPRRAVDYRIAKDIEARILALKVVTLTVVGATPDQYTVPAEQPCVAWIARSDWTERGLAHDGFDTDNDGIIDDYEEIDRRFGFEVWLAVRGGDPDPRMARLCDVEEKVQDAIDGKDLADVCDPDRTATMRGRDDRRVKHPEARSVIMGECYYRIPGFGGRGRL